MAGSPDRSTTRDVRGGRGADDEAGRTAVHSGLVRVEDTAPLLPSVSLWPGSDHFSPHVCARPTAPYPIAVVAIPSFFVGSKFLASVNFKKKLPATRRNKTDSQLPELLGLGW